MIDQSKVTSGYDVEFLITENYIKYFLLASYDTGTIPTYNSDDDSGIYYMLLLPPPDLYENRRYLPNPSYSFGPNRVNRLPPPQSAEGSFVVRIINNDSDVDIEIDLFFAIVSRTMTEGGNDELAFLLPMTISLKFGVISDRDRNGFQTNIRLHKEVLDINGPLVDLYTTIPDPHNPPHNHTKAQLLQQIKEKVDGDVPFNLTGSKGGLQTIITKKFSADNEHPAAIGIYINLKLRNGEDPANLVDEYRGLLVNAQNFLPLDHNMGFAFAKGLYKSLGDDIFYRLYPAEKEDRHVYPPILKGKKQIGKIYSVKAEPRYVFQNNTLQCANIFQVVVSGQMDKGDQDFTLTVFLIPKITDGFLDWDTDYDIDFGLLDLIPFITYSILVLLTMNIGTGTLLFFLLKILAEKVAKEVIVSQFQDEVDTSFFDLLPHKLVVEKRRWDPAYLTNHQVVSKIVQMDITMDGFAMLGKELFVAKEPEVINHVVPRNKIRDDQGNITALIYRLKDWQTIKTTGDLENIFAATDRMSYALTLPDDDPGVQELLFTFEMIDDRLATKRIQSRIPYRPMKVDIREGQIYQLLMMSEIELQDIPADYKSNNIGRVRNQVTQFLGDLIMQETILELTGSLGRTPTTDEVNDLYNKKLNARVDDVLNIEIKPVIDGLLKFEMEPSEFAELIGKKIIAVNGYMVAKAHHHGVLTVFLRDDYPYFGDDSINLLDLPRYHSDDNHG